MAETTTITDAPITLTPPDPVPVVAPTQAAGLVALSPNDTSKLDGKVQAFDDEMNAIVGLADVLESDEGLHVA